MKTNKLILGVAALSLGSLAFAQSVSFHAAADFTTYGISQEFKSSSEKIYTNDNGNATDSTHTDPYSGYDPDGNMKIDVNVRAANFEFNLGLYFNADGGDEEYYDYSDNINTPFYQGNMKVGFLEDQVKIYTGKFDDFNAGYIEEGYALGSQSITNLADSDFGAYLTGLEFTPYAIKGLKFFAGFPILPTWGNGIPTDFEANNWKYLGKKVKLAAQYTLPENLGLPFPLTVNAGWRPWTCYDGVDQGEYQTLTETFTKSQFGEAYLQVLLPNIVPDFLSLNVSYDIRYRDSSYTNVKLETEEVTALAHMFGISADLNLIEELALSVEDRFYYAGDDYLASDEKMIYDVLAASVEYAVPAKPFSIGANIAGTFAADVDGSAFSTSNGYAEIDSYYFDGVQMGCNDMLTADTTGLTKASTYLGAYLNPYLKVRFDNGALTIGAELQYTCFFDEDVTNTAFTYRIPVGLSFAF